VASYNQKAISFYEKFGFKKTGKSVIEDVARFPSGATIPEIEMVRDF
jgi:RimJ/RimL family protein N-acetyltransferase